MKLRHSLLPALLASGLALSGCKAGADTSPKAAPRAAAASATPSVRLAATRPVERTAREEVTGTLFPAKALMVGFEVGGRLARLKVQKGERIEEGQLMAQLDSEIAQAQVAQAQAALAAAQAGAEMAEDVAGRNAQLKEKGSVSEVANRSAATQAAQARAQVLAARAQLAQASAARSKHDLRAPFAGTVIDAPDQVGAIVGPGVPLFKLEQLDSLVLRVSVPESVRAQLKEGTQVRVQAVGGRGVTEEATVRLVVPSADPQSRRIPVEVLVPNKDGQFVANSLARATLSLGGTQQALAVPATALASTGGDHVLVLGEGETVKRVPVEVLERGPQEVVVRSATPLDRVIDHPTDALAEGTRVSVK